MRARVGPGRTSPCRYFRRYSCPDRFRQAARSRAFGLAIDGCVVTAAAAVASPEEADRGFMRQSLRQAERAQAAGEVQVGAALVLNGEVAGEGFNAPISCDLAAPDPKAHNTAAQFHESTTPPSLNAAVRCAAGPAKR